MNNQEKSNINNDQENKILITNSNKFANIETKNIALKNKRIVYFDWLRILSSFSVVFLHVSSN